MTYFNSWDGHMMIDTHSIIVFLIILALVQVLAAYPVQILLKWQDECTAEFEILYQEYANGIIVDERLTARHYVIIVISLLFFLLIALSTYHFS